MTQKEYNVYELKLSMDKVQSHCTCHICKDSASYLPSLTTNPMTGRLGAVSLCALSFEVK